MTQAAHFVMAGGHTGGHITPALAVARVLREHGHAPVFIGTERGLEARLVPAAGFPIEWIEIGGVKGRGARQRLDSLGQMPVAVRKAAAYLARYRPRAVFSMGGFVAAPVVAAAILRRVPLIVMEPNAMPGAVNRYVARFVRRALLNFPEAARFFPRGRSEISGMPVRAEFFAIPPKPAGDRFHVLITGGSQGARTLNDAARDSWPLLERARIPVAMTLQSGTAHQAELSRAFEHAGIEGKVLAFIPNMPAAFSEADLIVSRSGAGTVSEIAAAGKPSLLVPYPFAADQHQLRNAEAFVREGAARMVEDRDLTGRRLFEEIRTFYEIPSDLQRVSEEARRMAKPGAAERAAAVLEECA